MSTFGFHRPLARTQTHGKGASAGHHIFSRVRAFWQAGSWLISILATLLASPIQVSPRRQYGGGGGNQSDWHGRGAAALEPRLPLPRFPFWPHRRGDKSQQTASSNCYRRMRFAGFRVPLLNLKLKAIENYSGAPRQSLPAVCAPRYCRRGRRMTHARPLFAAPPV